LFPATITTQEWSVVEGLAINVLQPGAPNSPNDQLRADPGAALKIRVEFDPDTSLWIDGVQTALSDLPVGFTLTGGLYVEVNYQRLGSELGTVKFEFDGSHASGWLGYGGLYEWEDALPSIADLVAGGAAFSASAGVAGYLTLERRADFTLCIVGDYSA
jgi:hypothetical protein